MFYNIGPWPINLAPESSDLSENCPNVDGGIRVFYQRVDWGSQIVLKFIKSADCQV